MERYILKDSLNTYIAMFNSLDEIYTELDEIKLKFQNEYYSTFGARLDGSPTYEDSALFNIPENLRHYYSENKYITFYFFCFDIETNKVTPLY
jgi:hypothetical protein